MKVITATVHNWKQLERHPLSAEYPDLDPDAHKRMCDSLKKHGIVGDRHITIHEDMVLDGWQLFRACKDADIEPRFQVLPGGIEPAEFVEIMNDDRRHEDMQTMMRRAEERRSRVAELKLQGKSERAIAEEVGISKTQVRRDLEEVSGGPGGPPEPESRKVTGKDGKTYAASQAKLISEIAAMTLSGKIIPQLEALPRGEQQDFVRLCNEGMLPRAALRQVQNQREPGDESVSRNGTSSPNGRAASRSTLEAFNIAKFEELDSLVRQLERGVDELARLPGGEQLLRWTQSVGDEHKTVQRCEQLEVFKRFLKGVRPHKVCPYCIGKAVKDCKGCNGSGWVSKDTWDGAEDQIKERVK
jgi:hypothetical protein